MVRGDEETKKHQEAASRTWEKYQNSDSEKKETRDEYFGNATKCIVVGRIGTERRRRGQRDKGKQRLK